MRLVFPCGRILALLCGLVLLHLPSGAAILIHDFALRGTLEDAGGGNALASHGGEITALGYVFAANQGVTFSSRLFTPQDFSIEFTFQLNSTSEVTKLVDFHHLTSDPGLYQKNGSLSFLPEAASPSTDLLPGVNTHVVFTREGATGIVTAYVNGEQRFTFHDDLSLAVPPGFSNKLSFFVGDEKDAGGSGGVLHQLRVYNGALTAAEVKLLFSNVPPVVIPEPSTVVLLSLGGAAAMAAHLRRKRRPRD